MTTNKAGEQPTITQSLKPCPFCGGEAELSRDQNVNAGAVCEMVACASKFCVVTLYHRTEAEAIAAWNTRASLAAQDGLVEALERISSGRSSVTECSLIARQALPAIKGDKS